MTTLIAAYNSDGCIGRCDARCHDAVTPVCNCICGGANHGVGEKQAIKNNQMRVEEMITEYCKDKDTTDIKFEIKQIFEQLSLGL